MSIACMTGACHNLEGPTNNDPNHLLTRLPWKYASYKVDGRPIDNPPDSIQFRPAGTSILSDGKNSTDGSRWEFASGNRELIFNKGTSSQTRVEVIELTRDVLEFKSISIDSIGARDAIDVRLVH